MVAASAVVHPVSQLFQFVTGVADNPRTPDTREAAGLSGNPWGAAGFEGLEGDPLVLTLGFHWLAFVLQKQLRAALSVLR